MKLATLTPPPAAAVPFNYWTARSIECGPGCYVLTNAGGDILYIGQAINVGARLAQHLDSGRHREVTHWGTASLVAVLAVDGFAKLDALERGWINQCELSDGFIPPLNKVHGHL